MSAARPAARVHIFTYIYQVLLGHKRAANPVILTSTELIAKYLNGESARGLEEFF